MDYSRFSRDEPMLAAVCEDCYALCICNGQTDEGFDTGKCPRRMDKSDVFHASFCLLGQNDY